MALEVGNIFLQGVFQPQVFDFLAHLFIPGLVTRFLQLGIDDGDQNSATTQRQAKIRVELLGGFGFDCVACSPCVYGVYGGSYSCELTSNESNVESDIVVAIAHLIQAFGELCNVGDDTRHSRDSTEDSQSFGHEEAREGREIGLRDIREARRMSGLMANGAEMEAPPSVSDASASGSAAGAVTAQQFSPHLTAWSKVLHAVLFPASPTCLGDTALGQISNGIDLGDTRHDPLAPLTGRTNNRRTMLRV